jgi:hypothetical protein
MCWLLVSLTILEWNCAAGQNREEIKLPADSAEQGKIERNFGRPG